MKPVVAIFIVLFFCASPDISGQSAREYYKIAVNYAKDNNYSEAVSRFTKAIAADPGYERAYVERAKAYEVLKQPEKAADDWMQAAALGRKKGDYYLNAAMRYFETQQFQKSEQALDKLAEVNSKDLSLWQLRCRVYLETGNFVRAHQSATNAANQKRTVHNIYWLGVANDSLGVYEEAEARFKEILNDNRLYRDAYPALISVQLKRYDKLTSPYQQAELLKEAHEKCNTGLEIFPDFNELNVLRSRVHFYNHEYSKAIDDVSKAIAIDSDNLALRFARSNYYSKFGQHQNAVNDLNHIIRTHPTNARAHYLKGLLLEKSFEHHQALAAFEDAMRLSHDTQTEQYITYRDARDRILELNSESELPVIVLHHPELDKHNQIRVKQSTDSLEVNGMVKDQSRIRFITVNEFNAKFNRSNNNPEFSIVVPISGVNKLVVATSDWYNNTAAVAYDILFAEANQPEILITEPYVSDLNELYIQRDAQQIKIEGRITDESAIRRVQIEGVNASYPVDEINPRFVAYVDVTNKDRLTVIAEDLYGNVSEQQLSIIRTDAEIVADNPMGKTWVVFIENSAYSSFAQIDGPPKDVATMKSALAGYRIDKVVHKKNMTKNEMERFFSIELRDLVRQNSVNSLLVWYAGHGTYLSDIAYWIPVDGRRDDEFTYFNINNLKAGMQSYSKYITHTLVITDACDAGPSFADITRSDLSIMSCNNWEATKLRSSQVLSASGYQQATGQSPLSQKFAELLLHQPDACMPIEKVVLEMRDDSVSPVKAPRLGVISGMGHENGTFFFMRAGD